MFRITDGKGIKITFANGYEVSIQFGPKNYCQRRDNHFSQGWDWTSEDAEVAIFDPDGNYVTGKFTNGGQDVQGWMSPDKVLDALNWAAQQVKFDCTY